MSRRDALALLLASAATVAGCAVGEEESSSGGSSALSARPTGLGFDVAAGSFKLDLSSGRDGYLFVPTQVASRAALPLVLSLHGAGGSAAAHMAVLQPYAQQFGFLVLGVDSRGTTWDGIRDRFGPDVAFINRALKLAFSRYAVDPNRVVVSGFSDGASYALTLGLTNSALFRKIVAFSPGFIPPSDTPRAGSPRIFVSHGQNDPVLNIATTSRAIVPYLQGNGYDVTYTEFAGGHVMPEEIVEQAGGWIMT
jgi:phospholipase/carboxylesterase